MRFRNRSDAGRLLAARLVKYKGQHPVLLALPRGGVPVAAEVAVALGAPIDLVLVRKIGVPWQPELAMGAIVDGDTPIVVRNEDVIRLAGVDERDFQAVCEREFAEIERRRRLYLGGRATSASKTVSRSSSTTALRQVRQPAPPCGPSGYASLKT